MAPRKTSTPPPRAQNAPNTLEQLLERAESRDRIVHDERPAQVQETAVQDQETGREAGIEDTDDRFRSDAGAAFAELLAGLDAGNHIATSGPPRPSPRPRSHRTRTRPTPRPYGRSGRLGDRVPDQRQVPGRCRRCRVSPSSWAASDSATPCRGRRRRPRPWPRRPAPPRPRTG